MRKGERAVPRHIDVKVGILRVEDPVPNFGVLGKEPALKLLSVPEMEDAHNPGLNHQAFASSAHVA